MACSALPHTYRVRDSNLVQYKWEMTLYFFTALQPYLLEHLNGVYEFYRLTGSIVHMWQSGFEFKVRKSNRVKVADWRETLVGY